MPTKPAAVCHHPGCRYLTPCPEHKPSHHTRTNPRSKIYDTKRWKTLRLQVLLEEPTCRQPECIAPSADVDHIVALRNGGDPWDRRNLQALCTPCHSRKTAHEIRLGQR